MADPIFQSFTGKPGQQLNDEVQGFIDMNFINFDNPVTTVQSTNSSESKSLSVTHAIIMQEFPQPTPP